jgi:hypothetical protein
MKFLKSLLIIFCLIFVHSLAQAVVECDNPDAPEQVRIYFANGMNNEPKDINESWKALRDLVGQTSDRSFGKSINTKEIWYRQMLEVFAQKESEPSKYWEWLANMSLAPQWFQDEFNTHMTLINTVSYVLDAELRTMVNEYLQDLNSGKKVVIVSHSQGNLYANAAYQFIKDNYPKYKNSIGIVAVGTPAGRVQDGGWYTTNSLDFVVNMVRLRYYVLPANGTYVEPGSFLNHNFIGTYLTGFGTKIKNDIIATIARLEMPEKDFECKKPVEVPVIVQTTEASNISATAAFLNGYVVSGKQILGYCLWRKAENGAPASCWDSLNGLPTSGDLNTGEYFYCVGTGLSPNTVYNYRVCGLENNRIADGGMNSFQTLVEPDISTNTAKICIIDVNSILDDYYNMYLNGVFVGAIRNYVGGQTCYTRTFQRGSNTLLLDIVQLNGESTYLELNINNGEYVQYFDGSRDHIYTVNAP